MATYRSIRHRSRRRHITKTFDLQLTAMLDIMTIILVFLLKSYSASTSTFTGSAGVELPYSSSRDIPSDSLHLAINPQAMTFEDERILEFLPGKTDQYQFKRSDLDEESRRILPLYDALVREREKSEQRRAQSKQRPPTPFEGVLAIEADRRISYDTIRKVMYTAAAANYKIFRFLAVKREE